MRMFVVAVCSKHMFHIKLLILVAELNSVTFHAMALGWGNKSTGSAKIRSEK